MTAKDFKTALFENIDLPFEFEDVGEVESNCGSTWINLKDGSSFFITVGKCKNPVD